MTESKNSRIFVAAPDLNGNEEKYITEAVRSTWISSSGKYIDRFEQEFAAVCETNECITVSNGTVALHLALLALDVQPGDEVIVPSLTFVATANAVQYVGATPVFVDVDPETWCLSPERVAEAVTPKTRGIIAVHLYGHPADMDRLNEIADQRGLWLVEDAAEAPFAHYKGRATGGLGTIGTFSFYGNKVITSGEGGAVTLNDPELAKRARTIRGQGVDPERRYYFPVIGHNFRLTNVACALLCAQMERIDFFLESRRAIYRHYDRMIANIPGIALQPVADWATISPWLYCVTFEDEFGFSRDEVAEYLAAKNVETRPFFIPLHTLPPYQDCARKQGHDLSVTMQLGRKGINLPTCVGMSVSDIERIVELLEQLQSNR